MIAKRHTGGVCALHKPGLCIDGCAVGCLEGVEHVWHLSDRFKRLAQTERNRDRDMCRTNIRPNARTFFPSSCVSTIRPQVSFAGPHETTRVGKWTSDPLAVWPAEGCRTIQAGMR